MKNILIFILYFVLITFVLPQTQLGNDIDGEAGYDRSGYSVLMDSDGSHVAIGAYYNDDTGTSAGHVRKN